MKTAIAIGALLIALFFSGCVQEKPFSEEQVTLVVSGDISAITSDSGFFPTLTIINQSGKKISLDIGAIVCEICDGQSFQPPLFEIPSNSSGQVALNGELAQSALNNNGEFVIPAGTTIFTVKYSVEGEAAGSFHILQYKK